VAEDWRPFPDPRGEQAIRLLYGLPVEPPPQRVRFRHRYPLHIVLFLATMFTTSLAGGCHAHGFRQVASTSTGVPLFDIILLGLSYSVPIMVILAAHEFGHYAYCRKHQVDATLPYFIPAPVFLTGTFGAVIKIKEMFPSKKALFDIGVAGPIAGFIALLPFLFWGVSMSAVAPSQPSEGTIYFGEPLLYRFAAWVTLGDLPANTDVFIHPMAFAAWFGMLATALNLLPFGQLDGGHIVYSLVGRRSSIVSLATLGGTLMLTTLSSGWWTLAILMLIMAFMLGLGHPSVLDEDTPLDGRRKLVALFALLMLAVCFTPVPISFFLNQ
jgi:membrane-associated protease RseP (regulator of RpoE activity)